MTSTYGVNSSALEATRVIANRPRKLLDLTITNTAAGTRFFHVFDQPTVPIGWNQVQTCAIDFSALTGADVINTAFTIGGSHLVGPKVIGFRFKLTGSSYAGTDPVADIFYDVSVAALASDQDIADALVTVGNTVDPLPWNVSDSDSTVVTFAGGTGYAKQIEAGDTGAVASTSSIGSGTPVMIGVAVASSIASFDEPVTGKSFDYGISVVNSTAVDSITGSAATSIYNAELLCAAP